jgi:hypothetical protein
MYYLRNDTAHHLHTPPMVGTMPRGEATDAGDDTDEETDGECGEDGSVVNSRHLIRGAESIDASARDPAEENLVRRRRPRICVGFCCIIF